LVSGTDLDTAAFADAVLAALSGQECTLVRASYADELVVGFGTLRLADWPLRKTQKTPWMLYSRYGTWYVTDGSDRIATDHAPLTEGVLQKIRAVLVNQRVLDVAVDHRRRSVLARFENGAGLSLSEATDSRNDEPAWSLDTPAHLRIDAIGSQPTIARLDSDQGRTAEIGSTLLHSYLRNVAQTLDLEIFEPPGVRESGIDAILAAPNGTILLVELKLRREPKELSIQIISTSSAQQIRELTVLPAAEITEAQLAGVLRRIVEAA
jgi:hypothetical protein